MECSVEWCHSESKAKGFCNRHYLQDRYLGGIMKTRKDSSLVYDRGDYCEVELFGNESNTAGHTKIDKEDEPLVSPYHWRILAPRSGRYAIRNNHPTPIFMHHVIMGEKREVDHINGDTLDNRKSNLRFCIRSENRFNVPKTSKTTKSQYKGVSSRRKGHGRLRWFAYITAYKNRKWVGTFDTQEAAALAYNEAAKELHGEYACLNEVSA